MSTQTMMSAHTMIDRASVDSMLAQISEQFPGSTEAGMWKTWTGSDGTVWLDHVLLTLGDGSYGILGADDETSADNWPDISDWIARNCGRGASNADDFTTYTAPDGTRALFTRLTRA